MTSRTCARLILIAGIAGLAQVQARAQATLEAEQPQFGTQPAPYAQPSQPNVEPATAVSQPGAYSPTVAAYNSAPQQDSGGALGAPDPSKPLGRGDIVTFSIAQDRQPPQIMRVTDTGELDFSYFPKIGRISVVGRTCAEVAAELKHKLEADYYKAADVTMGINQINHLDSRGRVFVTGNVARPGPDNLPANEDMTVSGIIIAAGGPTQMAWTSKVQVTRQESGKTNRFLVDVNSIINKGHREKDVELLDGDYINVPQKPVNF